MNERMELRDERMRLLTPLHPLPQLPRLPAQLLLPIAPRNHLHSLKRPRSPIKIAQHIASTGHDQSNIYPSMHIKMTGGNTLNISSYLREYARITLASIKTPRKFFEEIKSEGKGYLKPFAYMLISNVIYLAGSFLGFFILPGGSNVLAMSFSLFKGLFVFYIFLTILFMLIYFGSMHLAVRIVKGKGKFFQTFKVICYSYSPFNFIWVFILILITAVSLKSTAALLIALLMMLPIFAGMLYVFYILVVGISVTSEISGGRAFAALMIQLFIYSGTIFSLIFGAVLLYSFSENSYSKTDSTPYYIQNYEKYNTTVYAGSAPQIDGIVDEKDRWYEGESFHIERKKYYTITTKHDFENIYILVQWYAPPEWKDGIDIYFEQDGNSPDFNLKNGRTDNYYQGHFEYGPNSFRDAHYDSGYTVAETQNGNLKSGYKDGMWNLEWQIPLSSGDVHDIYINNYPTQIGFTIINRMGWDSWPPNSSPEKPETWGKMTVVNKKIR